MKNVVTPILLLAFVPCLFADTVESGDSDVLSLFIPIQGPIEITESERDLLNTATLWGWMGVGAFGANVLGVAVSLAADPPVGGILSLVSVGFWTAANVVNAVTHRYLSNEMDGRSSPAQRSTAAGLGTLVAGGLGIGALTAISLSFGDTSGVAEVVTYIFLALSTVAGGYGIYKTFEYADAAGLDFSFF